MDDHASVQSVATWVRSLVLLPQSWFLLEDATDGLFKSMTIGLILGHKSIYRRPQDHWWLVQEPCVLASLILYGLAEVVLEHTTLPIARSADHDVPETDIMLSTWRTAGNADQQTDSDIRKAVYHIRYDACCRRYPVLPVGQDGD